MERMLSGKITDYCQSHMFNSVFIFSDIFYTVCHIVYYIWWMSKAFDEWADVYKTIMYT